SDVVALGPGLSRNKETRELVWKIVENVNRPILIDADGLNALSENVKILKRKKAALFILTPHAGELSRIIGLDARAIEAERVSVARTVARDFGIVLVLKGAPTVVAGPDGRVFVNPTGNPGMATAGAGDILSGIITGLWAQGLSALNAAICGVYLHGLAGDLAKNQFGEYSLVAMDIQDFFPAAVLELSRKSGEIRN
ncbi:MAG TPA: NAD(P)H-hydrate dehydratase, partial [Bacteroidota bacterium]